MIIILEDNIPNVVTSIKYLLDKASTDERIRQFALNIIGNNSPPIPSIYNWVKNNLRYVSDPVDIELFTSPSHIMDLLQSHQQIAEDCDGHAIFNVALFRSIGIYSNVVLIDQTGGGYNHALCRAFTGLQYINVDTTISQPLGWEEKYIKEYIVE